MSPPKRCRIGGSLQSKRSLKFKSSDQSLAYSLVAIVDSQSHAALDRVICDRAPVARHSWKTPLQRRTAPRLLAGNPQPLDQSPVYEARALLAGLVTCFSFASRVCAAAPEECGFCPVINNPSLTT
jgi:hypothetical protein